MRARGATALAWALVLVIGGVAIAGAGASGSHKPSKQDTTTLEASDSPEAPESPDPQDSVEPSHSPGDTHGACVSHWAHESKTEGLTGSARGQFIASVAQSDQTGADCDFSAALKAGLAGQTPTTHGNSAKGHSHHQPTGTGS